MVKKVLKRIYIIMALLFMSGIFCFIPNSTQEVESVSAVAEETAPEGTWLNKVELYSAGIALSGDGTYESPFLIEDAEDLAYVSYMVNSGQTTYRDKVLKLVNDIDLSGALWTPIYEFQGILLGNHKTISNITITQESLIYQDVYVGLFAVSDGAVFMDFKVAGNFIYASNGIEQDIGVISANSALCIYSNVRDESNVVVGDYKSIGFSNGNDIIRSASFDGATADLKTKEAVDNAFTVEENYIDAEGEVNTDYYYLRYHTLSVDDYNNGARFWYVDSDGVHRSVDGQVIGTFMIYDETHGVFTDEIGLFTNASYAYSISFGINREAFTIATKFTPYLLLSRSDATEERFYVKKIGYTPNILASTEISVADGFIREISFSKANDVSIHFDYEYGDRTLTSVFIPYDLSFSEIINYKGAFCTTLPSWDITWETFWSGYKIFDRLGYNLTYFTNKRKADNTPSGTSKNESCYTKGQTAITLNSFPITGETYYFPIDDDKNTRTEGGTYINFLIASDEGGSFTTTKDGVISEAPVISYVGGTYNGVAYTIGNLLGYDIRYKSGNNLLAFQLEKGYRINTDIIENNEGVPASSTNYGKPSGIYLDFPNHTSTGNDYSVEGANNDDYAPTSIGNITTEPGPNGVTNYYININNHCSVHEIGDFGRINIVIEREWVNFNITPVWNEGNLANDLPITFTYEIIELNNDASAGFYNRNLAYLYIEGERIADTTNGEWISDNKITLNTSFGIEKVIPDDYKYDKKFNIIKENLFLKIRYNEFIKLKFTPENANTVSCWGENPLINGETVLNSSLIFASGTDRSYALLGRTNNTSHTDMRIEWLDEDNKYINYHIALNYPQTLVNVEFYDEHNEVFKDDNYKVPYEALIGNVGYDFTDDIKNLRAYQGIRSIINGESLYNVTNHLLYTTANNSIEVATNSYFGAEKIELFDKDGNLVSFDLWDENNHQFIETAELGALVSNYSQVQYTIKVYLKKTKYQVFLDGDSNYTGDNNEDTVDKLFNVKPYIYEIGNETNSSDNILWVEWDKKVTVGYELSEVGDKILFLLDLCYYSAGQDSVGFGIDEGITIFRETEAYHYEVEVRFASQEIRFFLGDPVDIDGNSVDDDNFTTDDDNFTTDDDCLAWLKYDDSKTNDYYVDSFTISNIILSNKYYFKAIKWEDTTYNTFEELLNDYDFLEAMIEDAKTGTVSTVNPVLDYNTVTLKTNSGQSDKLVGSGEKIYKSDLVNTINANTTENFALEKTFADFTDGINVANVYYTVGHTFSGWSCEEGQVKENKFKLTLGEFSKILYGSTDTTHTVNNIETVATGDVLITAGWVVISYYVEVDGVENESAIIIDEDLYASTTPNTNAKITYLMNGITINGKTVAGYDAKAFTITSADGSTTNIITLDDNGEATVKLSNEWIETYLPGDYRFMCNDGKPVKIALSENYEASEYKLYIAENSNDYYSVSGNDNYDANGYYVTIAYGSDYSALGGAIANTSASGEKISLSRNFFTLTGFTYTVGGNTHTINLSNLSAGQFTSTENITLTPVWAFNSDLSGLINLQFINGADTGVAFRLATDTDILNAQVQDDGWKEVLKNKILTNGIKITDFDWYIGADACLNDTDTFATRAFSQSGTNINIVFKMKIVDTLNNNETTAESKIENLTVVQNELEYDLSDADISTTFTGINSVGTDFTGLNTIKVAIKYDFKGSEITSKNWVTLNNLTNTYSIDGDCSVGDRNLQVTLNNSVAGNGLKYVGGGGAILVEYYEPYFSNFKTVLEGVLKINPYTISITADEKFTYDENKTEHISEEFKTNHLTLNGTKYTYQYKVQLNQTAPGTYSYENMELIDAEVTDPVGNNNNFTFVLSSDSTAAIGAFTKVYMQLEEALTYVYNGLVVNNATFAYNGDANKYILTLKNGSTLLASAYVKYGYKQGGEIVDFSDVERDIYVKGITFDFSGFSKNVKVGSGGEILGYPLKINGFKVGGDDIAVEFEGTSTVTITKRPITVNDVEKIFDASLDFDTNNTDHTLTITGLVDGETLRMWGEFQSGATGSVGNDDIYIYFDKQEDGKYINENAHNYTFDESSPNTIHNRFLTEITISPAEVDGVLVDSIVAIFEETYGDRYMLSGYTFKDIYGEENINKLIFSLNGKEISLEQALGGKALISTLTIPSGVIISTSGYLKAGTHEFIGKITVVNLKNKTTGSNQFEIPFTINVKKLGITLENGDKSITKVYDTFHSLPNEIIDTNVTTSGTNAYVKAVDMKAEDIITIASGTYSDNSVSSTKTINCTFNGADAENYNITCSATGSITPRAVKLEISGCYLITEPPEELGSNFAKTQIDNTLKYSATVWFTHDNMYTDEEMTTVADVDALFKAQLPIISGYEFVGYSYVMHNMGDWFIEATNSNIYSYTRGNISGYIQAGDEYYSEWFYAIYQYSKNNITVNVGEGIKLYSDENKTTELSVVEGKHIIENVTLVDEISLYAWSDYGYAVVIDETSETCDSYISSVKESCVNLIEIKSCVDSASLTLTTILQEYMLYFYVHPDFTNVVDLNGDEYVDVSIGEKEEIITYHFNYKDASYLLDYWVIEDPYNEGEYIQVASGGDTEFNFCRDAEGNIDKTSPFWKLVQHWDETGSINSKNIYAVFTNTKSVVNISVTGGEAGSVIFKQGDLSTLIANNNVAKSITLNHETGNVVTVSASKANKGYDYEFEFINADGDKLAIEVEDLRGNGENIARFEMNLEIKSIHLTFIAQKYEITVQAGIKIGGLTNAPSAQGGKIYLTDSNGNKLDDSKYENVQNFSIGSNYKVTVETGNVLYFILEAESGYNGAFSSSASVSNKEVTVGGKEVTVYIVSGIYSDCSVSATFSAEERTVTVSFVTSLDELTPVNNAGSIKFTPSDTLSQSEQEAKTTAKVIHGTSATFTAKAKLGYKLFGESTDWKIMYLVKRSGVSEVFEVFGSNDTHSDDWISTGFYHKITIDLDNVEENCEIYVLVIPNTYKVIFKDNVGKVTVGSAMVEYGGKLEQIVAEEGITSVLNPVSPKDFYMFNGYWTTESILGKQYVDKNAQNERVWAESGYMFKNDKYETVDGYISAPSGVTEYEGTFTLYARWELKKAILKFEFKPMTIHAQSGHKITSLIQNESIGIEPEEGEIVLFPDQDPTKYLQGEVYYGAKPVVKAPDFAGYVFNRMDVIHGGQTVSYTKQTSTITGIETGDYTIRFIYYPEFSMVKENVGSSYTDGGNAWVEQGGKQIGADGRSGYFDYAQELTIKAQANEGYIFKGWHEKNSKVNYMIDPDEHGVYTYTFDANTFTQAVDFVAIFEGQPINVTVYNEELLKYHSISLFTINGNPIELNSTDLYIRVGDVIKIEVQKSIGYKFTMLNQHFEGLPTNDPNTFICRVGVDNVAKDGEGNNLIKDIEIDGVTLQYFVFDISFSVEKEQIKLFIIKSFLEGDKAEKAKIGAMYFVDANGQKTKVDNSQNFTIYYGENVAVYFTVESYYTVSEVSLIHAGKTSNLTDYLENGRFILSAELLEKYFAKELYLEMNFKRQTWKEVMSTTLEGEGTKEDPFIISRPEDFAYMSYSINNGLKIKNVWASMACYVVTNSINFAGRYWEPIGVTNSPFNGQINLGRHVFSNAISIETYDNPKVSYSGLFWKIGNNAVIIQETDAWIVWVSIAGSIFVMVSIFFIARLMRKKRKARYNEYL